MKTLVGVVGGYVVGDRFWGREKELARLLELIIEGAHVSIIAQRRIGKTSLMYEAGNHLPSDYIVLHLDLQAAESSADVVAKLTAATKPHASLWKKTKSVFANILTAAAENIESISCQELEIHIRAGLSGGNWQAKGSQVLAALAAQEKPVVLFIDELPILILRMLENTTYDGKAAAQALLTWLREQALRHQGRLSMVLAGSIGLEPVLSRAGLTANINHLTPFILEPWTDAVALGCLQALAAYRGITLPETAAQHMLELLGCNIPHHIQLFFAKVREYCQDTEQASCRPEVIDDIFKRRMLSIQGHAELAHMEERLQKVLQHDDLFLAMDLLTQAAVTGSIDRPQMHLLCDRYAITALESNRRLPELLRILEHDGYLKKNTQGKYVFVSNLLRQWWRARFEAFFETV